MPSILFKDASGETTVVVPTGTTVMRAAMTSGIEGIIAECGGSAMCATCHVYVGEQFLGLLPAMNETEDAMLESVASERKSNSRLSCQIVVTDDLDGLEVMLPPTQV